MNTVSLASRITVLPSVFVTASVRAPARLARRNADSMSAVSPLWVTATTSVHQGSRPPMNSHSEANVADARTSACVSNSVAA